MEDNKRSGGIGFCGLLTIVFIVLKLLKVINWEWWLILSPLWLPIILLGVLIIAYIIAEVICRK